MESGQLPFHDPARAIEFAAMGRAVSFHTIAGQSLAPAELYCLAKNGPIFEPARTGQMSGQGRPSPSARPLSIWLGASPPA
jgi:hypothetical protein